MTQDERNALVVAYGYLWMFQGDSDTDINAHFAFMARLQLKSILTKEEMGRGIAMAQAHCVRNGLPFVAPAH